MLIAAASIEVAECYSSASQLLRFCNFLKQKFPFLVFAQKGGCLCMSWDAFMPAAKARGNLVGKRRKKGGDTIKEQLRIQTFGQGTVRNGWKPFHFTYNTICNERRSCSTITSPKGKVINPLEVPPAHAILQQCGSIRLKMPSARLPHCNKGLLTPISV